MKGTLLSAFLAAISLFGSPLFAADQPKAAATNNPSRLDESKVDPLLRIEETRAALQKQIDELKAENAELKKQVVLITRVLTDALNGGGKDRSAAAAPSPLRLRVKGTSRRDVYQAPNSDILGKIEPGAVVHVLRVTEAGGSRWCLCELESGEMYTAEPPARALAQGWIWGQALEAIE